MEDIRVRLMRSWLWSWWQRLLSLSARSSRGGWHTTGSEDDVQQTQPITFEQQAEADIEAVLCFDPAVPDEDKATWYAALFLMDYRLALNSSSTTEDHFIAAYGNRALSIRYCQPDEMSGRRDALDAEAYRLRQEWRIGKGA